MNEILPVVFTVVLIVITIVLTVVGIQVIMVLAEIKRTLSKANQVIDNIEEKANRYLSPIQSLGTMAASLKSSMKVFQGFVSWLNRNKNKSNEE